MKARNETSDPGQNHRGNSKNGGDDAFAQPSGGQDSRDTPPDNESVGVSVRKSNTSNPINGSGGTCKTFSSGQVKGSNP